MSIVRIDGSRAEVRQAERSGDDVAHEYAQGSATRAKHFRIWELRKKEGWPPAKIRELVSLSAGHIRRIVRQLDAWLQRKIFGASAEAA